MATVKDVGTHSKSSHHRRYRLVLLMMTLSAYSIIATIYLANTYVHPAPSSIGRLDSHNLPAAPEENATHRKRRLKQRTVNEQKLVNGFKANLNRELQAAIKRKQDDASQEYICDSQGADAYLPETDLIHRVRKSV
jgi:hypothetical protein